MTRRSANTKYFAEKIIDCVQELEDLGGPDTIEEYVAVLTVVKRDVEERLAAAADRLRKE